MNELCSTSTAPAARPSPRTRARVRYHAVMKLVRRTHMYAGLFLVPWVFLYGVTAFLFNHPDVFADREVQTGSRSDTSGTPLEGFPTAPTLATAVVDALNTQAGGPVFRIVEGETAIYSRPITVTATGKERDHSVRFDPETGAAIIRSTASSSQHPKFWPSRDRVVLSDPPHTRLATGVPALLARLGIEPESTAVLRNPPDLVFTAQADGRPWRVVYNIQTERISAQPADDPRGTLSTRRFLTGLHLAFGYPARPGSRWFWAVVVDVMAAAMVLWGCSGLFMWWQMKSLRRWGTVTLLASAVAASCLALGMHAVLSR
jgi:hypothetical protein